MSVRPVNMEFLYGTSFMSQSPEAYERLILDTMRGDATLFARDDEVEAAWAICDPILEAWGEDAGAAAEVRGRLARPGRGRRADRCRTPGGRSDPRRHRRLERAGHVAREDRGRAAAAARGAARGPTRRTCRRACSTSWRSSSATGAARSSNRLEQLGRFHPSRTIVCSMEHGRTELDAWATMTCDPDLEAGGRARLRGAGGDRRRARAPGAAGHDRRPAARARPRRRSSGRRTATPRRWTRCSDLADVFLVDSVQAPDPRSAVHRARPSCSTTATWSTSRGCAARRGASGSRRRSTRPCGARRCRDIESVTDPPPPRVGDQRRCCWSAGWRRGSAGRPARVIQPQRRPTSRVRARSGTR